MKTELLLDHENILANLARPVHFALRFTADAVASAARQPAAFCVVLDHSGSMECAPLEHALYRNRAAHSRWRQRSCSSSKVVRGRCNLAAVIVGGDLSIMHQ